MLDIQANLNKCPRNARLFLNLFKTNETPKSK